MCCAQVFTPIPVETQRAPKVIEYSDLEFDHVIGSGGFGEVWLGIYKPTNTKVAIKKIHSDELSEDSKSEIALHAQLNHRFLLPFIGYTNTYPFCIVTEYIPNGSLYDALHSVGPQVSLSPTDLTVIAYCISVGMEYIHSRNIIHMDLKTLNILLDSQFLPKISDFGISSNRNTEEKQQPNHQDIGTAAIMAPELHRYESYDQSVDVYSFGIILWEMLTHDVPFADKEPMQIVYAVATNGERPPLPNDVPIPLMKLINACWAEDPKLRPSFHDISLKFLSGEVYFKGSIPAAFRRYMTNFDIAKIPTHFVAPVEFSFPDSNLLPPSYLKTKNPNLMGIQFEVQPMSTEEVIEAMSVPDHPKFEDALDYVEEHLNVVEEIGEKFWEIFLPLMTSSHYKELDRIANILVYAAKKRSILKYIVNVTNPYTYLTPKSLELFLYVITYYPQVIDTMFVMHLQVILLKSQGEQKEHALSMLCKIMQYTENKDLVLQIVEFLLSAADKFVEEPCGKIALSAIVMYHNNQIQEQDIIALALRYLKSSLPDNIIAAYQALSCWPGQYKLPLTLAYVHIKRKEKAIVDLAIEAIRVSLHIDDIEEVSRTVLNLIESFIITRNMRAVLLICALADTTLACGASAIQVFFQEAICSAVFKIQDDIASDFLPLLILLFKVHHSFFLNHPLLPQFVNSIFRYGDNEALCVICDCLSNSKEFTDEFINSFVDMNIVETLCLRLSKTTNDKIVEYCAAFLKVIIDKVYFPQILLVVPILGKQLHNIKNPALNSIKLLDLMTKYPETIPSIKQLHAVQQLKKLTGIKEMSEAANSLVKKLQ